jgi:hypothetical protein
MSNDDQFLQGDPNQRQQQDPSLGQDPSSPAGGNYGLAGQGTMGDAMSRDVDPTLGQGAGQWNQDPNLQQTSQDPILQQGGQSGQDPSQQQGMQDPFQAQQGGQWSQGPNLQQGIQDPNLQQGMQSPNLQQGGQANQGFGQDPNQADQWGMDNQPNMQAQPGIQTQPGQQNITPAQGAPVMPTDPMGQMSPESQQQGGVVGDMPEQQDDQQASGGGLGGFLGGLFGRHRNSSTHGDPDLDQ